MRRETIVALAIGTILTRATFWNALAQQPARPDISGVWELVSAEGTKPPDGFRLETKQSAATLRVSAQWTEPENGQYGLTLVGLIVPELTFFLDGREDLNQAGPFVLRSKTRWNGARLITSWSTSEFGGMSFEGQWVRSLSPDGRELTLEIHANSSQGQHSDAALKFRRK